MNFKNLIFFILPLFCFAQESNIVITGEAKISYQKFGRGFPVLIINGGPGMNSNGFASLAALLSKNNTTIIYDQRGTGKSGLKNPTHSEISIENLVEDIEKLRVALGYDQWIILGHSFGGMLAYAYAAEYPERIKAMIQSHSGGMSLNNVEKFDITKRLTESENDSLVHYSLMVQPTPGNSNLMKQRAKYLAKAYLYHSKYEDQITERLLQVNRNINSQIWSDMRSTGFDKTEAMKSFQKPVLILHGDYDPVPVSIAKKADAIFPNSKLQIMENCGHYGWLDRPDIYLKEVKNFLKENSSLVN